MLWLIGMMGSGKSTVGTLVAERLGVPFIDVDDAIVTEAGMTIPEIFAAEGEEGFRARESAAVSGISGGVAAVVATGGGVPTRPGNVDLMRGRGVVVWLVANPATLAGRVEDDGSRPLLHDTDTTDRLTGLLEERFADYASAAHARIATDGRPLEEIVEEVSRLWPVS